jgi:hypothetical protein
MDSIPFFKIERKPQSFADVMKSRGYDLDAETVRVAKSAPSEQLPPPDAATVFKAIEAGAAALREREPTLTQQQAVVKFMDSPGTGEQLRDVYRTLKSGKKTVTVRKARFEVLAAAAEIQRHNPTMTAARAFIFALDTDPALAARYRAESA